MTFKQLRASNSIRALGILAIEQVGEVVGIRWRQVGKEGLRSARLYFRYLILTRARYILTDSLKILKRFGFS